MRQALAPLLSADEELNQARAVRDPVAPARASSQKGSPHARRWPRAAQLLDVDDGAWLAVRHHLRGSIGRGDPDDSPAHAANAAAIRGVPTPRIVVKHAALHFALAIFIQAK